MHIRRIGGISLVAGVYHEYIMASEWYTTATKKMMKIEDYKVG